MTILEQLAVAPKSPVWAEMIDRHKHENVDGERPTMGEWGRKGQSHLKDGTFTKN